MTLIHIWSSPGPVNSCPYLGITGTWILSYIPGPHLDLVNLVPICAPPVLVTLFPTWTCLLWTPSWPHLELVTLILTGPHPDLVTLVLTCGPL